MSTEEIYMLRCLELAQKGIGQVAPNPMVGAILVDNGRVIGEGWHQRYGGAHAEVNCIASVAAEDRPRISKSCLYVSLEPCSHFGKTPPCTDLIIREKIPEVVIGCIDPFAAVAGKGVHRLQQAGVKVKAGVLEQACRRLNKRFLMRQEHGRPYVILKWAESADGYLSGAGGAPVQLSGWLETRAIHRMRYEEDAILVGYNTALRDNPRLNNRFWKEGKQPLRVLIDFHNTLPDHGHIRDNNRETVIFNFQKEDRDGRTSWKRLTKDQPLPLQIMEQLPGVQSLIVEGGARTLQTFLDHRCWDEIHLWQSRHQSLGTGVTAPVLKHAVKKSEWTTTEDRLLLFVPDGQHGNNP